LNDQNAFTGSWQIVRHGEAFGFVNVAVKCAAIA
jgi:hypothetical protein